VKDHEKGLEETYSSLVRQVFVNWEMVVVVAESEDSTLKVAQRIQREDRRVKVIEQSGIGIYNAMNEGIRGATGDFIWFMNAGDRFSTEDVIALAVAEIKTCGVGVVMGGYQILDGKHPLTYAYRARMVSDLRFAFSRRDRHEAMIFRASSLKSIGQFNTSYSLASDFDLVMKVINLSGAKRVSEIYATIEPGGRADQGIFLVHSQKHMIRKNHFGGVFIWVVSSFWTLMARTKIVSRQALKR
jgi:glycosyltransferase involved in cell wall biosynthesis